MSKNTRYSNRTLLGLLLAAFLLSACAEDDDSSAPEAPSEGSEPSMAAENEGPSGEEELSGEAAELASDDVAFLARLGLIRGHLHAGHALYVEDYRDMAATHMKHPRDELYAGLVPAIEARGFEPFDAELTALKDAVESGADVETVVSNWREVDEAIETIERGTDATPADELRAIASMLDTSADEYAVGVVGGVVENEHEYQDSWGFMQIGLERVGQIAATSDVARSATAEAGVIIASLADLWPELSPALVRDADASRISDAAEQIRMLADEIG